MRPDVGNVIRYCIVTDLEYMQEALKEAKKAFKKKEVPVGCIIVKDDKIIARAHNLKEKKNSALCHAEIIAIKKASKKLKNWRLENTKIFITLEPCPMCMGAIIQARIKDVYYSTEEPSFGALGSKLNLLEYNISNPDIIVHKGLLKEESKELVQTFFKNLRS